MAKNKKKIKKSHQCNICGYPREIEYMEKDEESGKIVKKIHIVQCLGHNGIMEHLWNKHPKYDVYRKLYNRRKAVE